MTATTLADLKYNVSPFMLPHNTTFDDIEQVARTGGQGVGLHLGKIGDPEHDAVVREALLAAGIRATFCVARTWTILPSAVFSNPQMETDPRRRTEEICADLPRIAAFDPVAVVVGAGTSGDPDRPVGPVSAVVDGLGRIADTAAELGLTVAFELFGRRRGTPIPTLPEIVGVIDEVGRDNVRIAFDMFQSWPDPGLHEDLARYASRIINVDVCDARVEERSGFDRELPGHGRAAAPGIIATLLDAGYDGWWKLEVFSDDGTFGNDFPDSYWKMPHEQLLLAGRQAFEECLAEAARIREGRNRSAPVR